MGRRHGRRRRQRSEAIAYVVMCPTAEGRFSRYTIGRHGAPWTPERARKEAKRILGMVADGGDQDAERRDKRQAATVTEPCNLYIADAEAGRRLTRRGIAKNASTLATDKSRIERHIKPLLGTMKVPTVTRANVIRISPGEEVEVLRAHDLEPNARVYNFRLRCG